MIVLLLLVHINRSVCLPTLSNATQRPEVKVFAVHAGSPGLEKAVSEWHPPYQTGKTIPICARKTQHTLRYCAWYGFVPWAGALIKQAQPEQTNTSWRVFEKQASIFEV